MKLMVFGSEQNVTAEMLRTVRKVARRARDGGHTIMTFGTDGVCGAVIAACDELGLAIEVYGANYTFTRVTRTGANHAMPGSYQTRDENMLRGFQLLERSARVAGADMVICIWSGQRDETRFTMWRALRSGKPVWMYTRGAQRPRRCQPLPPAEQTAPEGAAEEAEELVPCLACSERPVGAIKPDLCDECARTGRDPRFADDLVDITALVTGHARV